MADNFKLDIDTDGIALITWDMPGRSMNVIDLAAIEELSAIVEKIAADAAIKTAQDAVSGEDLLSSTPRQIALYEALQRIGVTDFIPEFGHLPFVMGEGNKKLSKRDPQSNLDVYRERGFLPEGLGK